MSQVIHRLEFYIFVFFIIVINIFILIYKSNILFFYVANVSKIYKINFIIIIYEQHLKI
jgi:hypothetical protein